jgi:hypothetical protein
VGRQIRSITRSDEALIDTLAALSVRAGKTHAPEWIRTVDDAYETIHEALAPGALSRIDVVDQDVGHSYQFWLKVGYTIVGVLPDAEGPGMPSITLSKCLSR